MPVYKVFTWNMQRAQSVSRPRQDAMIMERYRVLKALVDWADFGFITEPGIVAMLLREKVKREFCFTHS